MTSAQLSVRESIRSVVKVAARLGRWTVTAEASEGLTLTAGTGACLGQIVATKGITLADNVTVVSATEPTRPGAANPAPGSTRSWLCSGGG